MELNWIDFTDNAGVVGFSSFNVKELYYYKIGSLVCIIVILDGTSNATTLTFTLPFSSLIGHNMMAGRVTNNSIDSIPPGRVTLAASSKACSLFRNSNADAWTNGGNKIFYGQFFYFTSEV